MIAWEVKVLFLGYFLEIVRYQDEKKETSMTLLFNPRLEFCPPRLL